MRYEDNTGRPQLIVSRRNLLTLLAKLDANAQAGTQVSACTIGDPDGMIFLSAEEDAVHYDPERRAALGHAPVPGYMVRDSVSQRPLNFHAIDPKQQGCGFTSGEDGPGELMNPDGAF